LANPKTGCPPRGDLKEKLSNLKAFWQSVGGSCAIGFSGGIDSAFLLASAIRWSKWPVYPFFVDSIFIPPQVHTRLPKMAQELAAQVEIISWEPLSVEAICQNSQKRCYFCKKTIYNLIKEAAISLDPSCTHILDGTQHDDLFRDRPGLKALAELSILTPLAHLGFTKKDIRACVQEWGYSFWDIPAESCLATRFERGSPLSERGLLTLYFELMPEKALIP